MKKNSQLQHPEEAIQEIGEFFPNNISNTKIIDTLCEDLADLIANQFIESEKGRCETKDQVKHAT